MINAYPQFYNLSQRRYSCRKYTDAPVARELLLAILDTARLAPSACNRQPWRFVVVAEAGPLRDAINASYQRDWMAVAPVCIVAVGLHDEAWHRPADGKDHTDVDVSIAVEHLCLAATSLGLGTCWVCNFDAAAVAAALNLPDNAEPVALIPVGWPDVAEGAAVPEKIRKPFDEIVKWGAY